MVSVVRGAWRLAQYLRAHPVDLVQTNSTFAHIYGGLAARLAGAPCIWYFHDLIERRRLVGAFGLLWRILAVCLATRVVGVSNAVIGSLSAGFRGCVIYAGCKPHSPAGNVHPDLRTQLSLPDDARVVGYIGRIAHVKALDVLARAAQQVVRAAPQVHFVLFGEALFGETDYKRMLVSIIKELKLARHWHWMGYDKQATARIPEFDLLVLPSRREALGLALVEAGMASKATVGSRVGGISEVIVGGETGLLVSPENPDELADATLRLLNDPLLAHEMGRKANDRVSRVFDLQRYHTEFLELYATVFSN